MVQQQRRPAGGRQGLHFSGQGPLPDRPAAQKRQAANGALPPECRRQRGQIAPHVTAGQEQQRHQGRRRRQWLGGRQPRRLRIGERQQPHRSPAALLQLGRQAPQLLRDAAAGAAVHQQQQRRGGEGIQAAAQARLQGGIEAMAGEPQQIGPRTRQTRQQIERRRGQAGLQIQRDRGQSAAQRRQRPAAQTDAQGLQGGAAQRQRPRLKQPGAQQRKVGVVALMTQEGEQQDLTLKRRFVERLPEPLRPARIPAATDQGRDGDLSGLLIQPAIEQPAGLAPIEMGSQHGDQIRLQRQPLGLDRRDPGIRVQTGLPAQSLQRRPATRIPGRGQIRRGRRRNGNRRRHGRGSRLQRHHGRSGGWTSRGNVWQRGAASAEPGPAPEAATDGDKRRAGDGRWPPIRFLKVRRTTGDCRLQRRQPVRSGHHAHTRPGQRRTP